MLDGRGGIERQPVSNRREDSPAMKPSDHLQDRAAKARKIIEAPQNFKVCEGCESIVTARVVTCPNCHGYRFDESPERVVEQANLLASRPQQSVTSEDLE